MESAIELIQKMLNPDPKARIDAAQALNSEFLTQDYEPEPKKIKISALNRL